jgi:hypothetical protein
MPKSPKKPSKIAHKPTNRQKPEPRPPAKLKVTEAEFQEWLKREKGM